MTKESSDQHATEHQTVEVVKGNPTPLQRKALEKLVGGIAERAEERRRAKPDTRGWYGYPGDAFRHAPEANPAGFRTPNLPQA